jgi:hypothetical protein
MKWTKGRQGTGYEKLKLLELGHRSIGGIDAYLLKYGVGDSIPVHTDPVPGKRHYRLNLTLRNAKEGGELWVEKKILGIGKRIILFRSDLAKHSVTEIGSGVRIVLTIGIAI